MVVEEPLTGTLCNCTTSPLKNSALFFFALYFQLVSIPFQSYVNFQDLYTPTGQDGRLVALPLDHMGAEFVILLATTSHTYAFQEIYKWATEILERTASSNSVFMESCSSDAVLDRRRCRAMRYFTPPLQYRRQMERARVSQEYTIHTSNASC